MKKLLLILIVYMAGQNVLAQDNITVEKADTTNLPSDLSSPTPLIGYLSYDSMLVAMPQYAIVKHQMNEMREAYEKELKRVEDEFNQKYEEFLENRAQFPRTILLKRQNELQDLLQRNVEFKRQGQEELQRAEREAMAPLRIQLNETIATIARELKLIMVVNTDSEACPFIEPLLSININEVVLNRLLN